MVGAHQIHECALPIADVRLTSTRFEQMTETTAADRPVSEPTGFRRCC